jgi:hypothetical protein
MQTRSIHGSLPANIPRCDPVKLTMSVHRNIADSPQMALQFRVWTHNGSRALAICDTAARVECTLATSDLVSARSQLSVRCKGPLEVVVFLAWKQAEISQRRQQLLGLGGPPEYQIGLAEMLMGATVAGI